VAGLTANPIPRLRKRGLRLRATVALAAWLLGSAVAALAQSDPPSNRPPSATLSSPAVKGKLRTLKPFAPGLPLYFEKNDGQLDRRASFMARMPGATLYLAGADAVLVHSTKTNDQASALRLHWAGAVAEAAPEGEAEMAARSNYFIGNEQSHWHTDVANFLRVRQNNLYPGVDLVYYGNQQQLEYDLTVHPGANPSAITLQIEGANGIKLDKASGDVVLVDAIGSPMRLLKPVVYQPGGYQQKTAVSGSYSLSKSNTVSLVLGDYDHSRPLIIDPEVVYSTMFGGTTLQTANEGTTPNNLYTGMTVDSAGDVYLSGVTSTINLPATMGAFQSGCNLYNSGALCSNFFVAKFDPTQSGPASLIYATYIGGNAQTFVSQDDGAKYNIAVDSEFNAYIVGEVSQGIYGSGYPTTSNAYVPTCTVPITGPTCAGVLTKLNPTGTALLYSTWLANSYSLAAPAMVAVDSNQVAYVAGAGGSGAESFLAAFPTSGSSTGTVSYSVGLPFAVMALTVDPTGYAYVGGEFFQERLNGASGYQLIDLNGAVTTIGSDSYFPGVLVKFNPAGQNTYATFFGDGSVNTANAVWGVAADPNGIAFVTGNDENVVQVNGLPSGAGGTQGAYLAEVDTTQTGMSSLLYSTYIDAADTMNETYAVASTGAGQFAFSGLAENPTGYPVTNPLTQPVAFPYNNPSYSQFIGMIDPSKAGEDSLIFLSFVDGIDQAPTLFLEQGSDEGAGGGKSYGRRAIHAKPQINGVTGPPNYNLYVAGYGLANVVSNPFLTGPTLASWSTSLAPNQTIAPFFYKIALGPIDCLTVSPYSLSFPSQELDTTSPPLSFTVTNSCPYAVSIASVTPSPQFNEDDGCTPSLPANQGCAVDVTFEPTVLSATNGVTYTPTTGLVSVNVTDSNAPLSVAVSGIGVSAATPTGFLSPQNIAFGSEPDEGNSAPVTVTLTNTGSVPLTDGVNNLIITSTLPSAAFTVNNAVPNGCGTSLAVGALCHFQVVFSPNTTTALYTPSQNYSQTVYAYGPKPALTMTLTGTGTAPAPQATLTPNPLTFPATSVGGSSGPLPVTLTNTGTLTLTGISVAPIAGADPTSFGDGGGCLSTSSLTAGESCTLNVTFNPKATGSLTASVTFTDGATPASQTVTLTGTGISPIPLAINETLHFTDAPVATGSTPLNINEALHFSDTESGLQPSTPLNIAEMLHFADADSIQVPPVVILDTETIHTTDTAALNLSLLVLDAETVHTIDTPLVLLPATIVDTETIHTTDTPAMNLALQVLDAETIHTTDTPVGLLPVMVVDDETIHTTDAPIPAILTLPTRTQLAASTATPNAGHPVTFTATVSSAGGTPTGKVTFYDGTTALGTVTLSNGIALYTTSSLNDGAHSIEAIYPGTAYFLTSASNTLHEKVSDFDLTVHVGSLVLFPGETRTVTFTVHPVGGAFDFPIVLSAAGLPPGATATFIPASITPGSGPVTTTLTIHVPLETTTSQQTLPMGSRTFVAAGMMLPFLGLLRLRRARKRALRWMLVALFSFGTAIGLSGCASGGFFAQPPHTYTVTVSATSNSVVHSTSFQLTVE
jgi:hypothetical protein